jgi:heme exporter protein A
VRWCGEPIGEAGREWRSNVMFLGHHAAVKGELTALENLEFAAALDDGELPQADAIAALQRFGLKGREELPVRFLSAGQKRRVLLARLVTRRARLWILDEPFTALDTKAVNMLSQLVGEHVAGGGMAVVTSHQPVPLEGGKAVEL